MTIIQGVAAGLSFWGISGWAPEYKYEWSRLIYLLKKTEKKQKQRVKQDEDENQSEGMWKFAVA